jgi:Ca2+-binding EF-hand superfamily protein
VERRHFVLYSDRLDYFSCKEDLEAGNEPRGRVALVDIVQCEESEKGFSLRLGGDRGLEVEVYEPDDLGAWLDSLEPLLEQEDPDSPQPEPSPNPSPKSQSPKLNLEPGPSHKPKATNREASPLRGTITVGTDKRSPTARGKLPQETLKFFRMKFTAAAYNNGKVDWKRLFRHYDKDNDGVINYSEFLQMVRSSAKIIANEMPDRTVQKYFDAINGGDEKMQYDEFVAWLDPPNEEAHEHVLSKEKEEELRSFIHEKNEYFHKQKEEEEKRYEDEARKAIRNKLKGAAYEVGGANWEHLWKRYVKDPDGKIDLSVFKALVRKDGKVTPQEVSDDLVQRLFNTVDTDGEGDIDFAEFVHFLDPQERIMRTSRNKEYALRDSPQPAKAKVVAFAWNAENPEVKIVRQKLRAAAFNLSSYDYDKLFDAFDKDCYGELTFSQFKAMVRKTAKVSFEAVSIYSSTKCSGALTRVALSWVCCIRRSSSSGSPSMVHRREAVEQLPRCQSTSLNLYGPLT